VITGNPIHYPGRHFHQFSWDSAHVIWFAPFQLSFIQNKISSYFMKLHQKTDAIALDKDELIHISQLINQVYAFFRDNTKFTGDLTLRDIENICIRSHLLKQHYPAASWKPCISQALYDELEGSINNIEKLQEFKRLLPDLDHNRSLFAVANVPRSQELVIPPGKEKIWRLILNDLLLRKLRIEQDTNYLGKLGTLLQGASGVGKSIMMIKMLEHLGFSRQAADPLLRFYQITVGSDNVEATLVKAFNEGSIVILDELNLDKELKVLLNQLLTGYDLKGNKANQPGFMILSTQNPPKYAGCFVSSREFDNRFHKINMGDYSLNDLEYIATALECPVAKRLTETYHHLRFNSELYNARSFFSALHKTKAPGPIHDEIIRMEANC
jgi:hypothetical protein